MRKSSEIFAEASTTDLKAIFTQFFTDLFKLRPNGVYAMSREELLQGLDHLDAIVDLLKTSPTGLDILKQKGYIAS